ncbi:Wadjet anti-phage system protein JetA family protein [Roseibium sp. RKSG952]|uniref:Wadjet anti-phage system protein JetA family protein n=1 Tax=Roseibium sp. RKSG952 TaxID=2529384 RepID=UPI0012BCD2D5|nr:Wadjet anti-phage system protein JetA family protein [Roseibium sp. RKSG952]MTH95777.1 hypothetical protein [Roseibium sp. RKSG952]
MALFDVLPTDLFKPLASPSRRFYADVLLFLFDRTFETAAEAPRRSAVLREIQDYILVWESRNGALSEFGNDTNDAPITAPEDRARTIYQRLRETGWLIEHKDRYIKLVDLDPDAAGLLHILAEIDRGETRSYGGAVVGVLSGLEDAAMNPAERSENIRNAVRGARDFASHMRTVSVSLRKVEDRILRQQSLRDVFRHFFEDFVERHLIADFKTLHTKENPFRFRSSIIHQARIMASDAILVRGLSESYEREGRARSIKEGERAVIKDLSAVIDIFERTEDHLKSIDDTVSRIERRIMTTAKYMDRADQKSEAKLIEALKALSKVQGNEVPLDPRFTARRLPIGPSHIATPRREREEIRPTEVRDLKRDPVMEARKRAKDEYVRRTRVTSGRLRDFIESALGKAETVNGGDIAIRDVDDFVAFQRLRELGSIFDGSLARHYEITHLDERCRNEWIDCQNFEIRRRRQETRNVA